MEQDRKEQVDCYQQSFPEAWLPRRGDCLPSQAACKLCRVVTHVEVGVGDIAAFESFLLLEQHKPLLLQVTSVLLLAVVL